jgi:hypothetical protein
MNVRRVMTALLLLTAPYSVCADRATGNPAPTQFSGVTTRDLRVLRPFVFGGLTLGGANYDVFAGEVGAGVDVEMKSLMLVADFAAQNSRSSYSRTGHILQGRAFAAHRTSRGWYFGGGAQWDRVVTDKNRFEEWRPVVVVGEDLICPKVSMRFQAKFVLPTFDHNGNRPGGEIALWFPSPATRHHLFFCIEESIHGYHALPESTDHEDFLKFRVVLRF